MGDCCYRWEKGDLYLNLRVQPRAARDEIVGPHGDALKVRITAPPVEGKANSHLLRYLSQVFAVPMSRIDLLRGATGRGKWVRITQPMGLPECLKDWILPAT